MSVGGRIIEIQPMQITAGIHPGRKQDVVRIAVMDRHDETCVYAEPAEFMPKLGDEIWWQGDRIFFDNDRRWLKKIAYSFTPPWNKAEAP